MSGPGADDLAIAVIGMACRFPGADTVEAFWENLRLGVESVSFFSYEELAQAGVPKAALDNPAYVRAQAVLRDVERFDAGFFGYTAREAQVLDPQQRLFLETSWQALERAGYDPSRYRGSVGVFGGVSSNAWAFALMSDVQLRGMVPPIQMLISSEKDFLATRVAYKLDLRGPAVVIQTACSTSLVAVHMACQSLLAGECDMALAGGVSVPLPQGRGYLHEPGGIASADGHCRAFDASANGTLQGTGAGLVVLKRLSDAVRDRDQIEAVIRGSAINNDGAEKVGFTAPGVEGQAAVIRAAQAIAGVGPEEITYVEAHGTGTVLGDPVEIGALTQAFGAGTKRRGYCAIGSVKTNFGHLDAAAGVAGLIKTVLMLKHGQLVPSLHFERPNPRLGLEASPFVVATRHAPWTSDGPRCAGVSSFGIGGTNAHVIVQEAPHGPRPELSPRAEILVLSARSQAALEQSTDELSRHLQAHPDLPLSDVAFTLNIGRRAFDHRRAVLSRDASEAAGLLTTRNASRVWSGRAEPSRPVAFLFPGQGAQAVNMARDLYESEPEVRNAVDHGAERLRGALGLDLRQLLYPAEHEAEASAERLLETCFTQPALFTIEYALARLWMSWGVRPVAMIGHSVGEYVAACLAGVMDFDEALAVVAERARLMQTCPRGGMTAVSLSAEALRPLLDGHLDLSVVNGLEACVAGGPLEEVRGLEERLLDRGVVFSRVPTSHAFHSALMEPALPAFGDRMARVKLHPPKIPFVSNLTGTWITAEQATDPAYWVRQLRETVRFSEGLDTVLQKAGLITLEVGPGQVLTALTRRRLPGGSNLLALPSLRHPRRDEADVDVLLQSAARLWCAGATIDWSPRDRRVASRRTTLPTYPFERERYWIDRPAPKDPRAPVNGDDAREETGKLPLDRWLHTPTWKRAETRPAPPRDQGSICVLADETGVGDAVAAVLRSAGAVVTLVRAGAEFAWTSPHEAALTPGQRADYERLLDELQARGGVPARFVHLWAVAETADDSMERGLLSLLHLGQALGRRQGRETDLLVVTCGAQDVLGDETLFPLTAAMLGPCRVIPQEYPLVRCRTLDVALGPPASDRQWLTEAVALEVLSKSTEPTVAYRGRARFVNAYEPLLSAEASASSRPDVPIRLRPRGVYLITGGLGKVGLALARYLARAVQARLVLTGRNVPGAEGTPAIRELEALGAEVLVVKADAGELAEMRNAIAFARERFGGVDGVVHAAGDLGQGVARALDQLERVDCERQLRPKLGGAQVLATVLADSPIDFVLLTSSLSTVLGGLGLGAYSAANHALDAFAQVQHRAGRRSWMSVAFDGWNFEPAASASRLLQTAISPAEGEELFARLLALGPRAQVVVSTTSLEARLASWTRPAEEARPEATSPSVASDLHPRPELGVVYVPPEDPVERRLAAIWGELLGIDRVGVDDNFFELGGSSLLAVHLMGKVKKEFPVERLSVASLFEAPTVRALREVITARRGPEPGLARSADRGHLRKENRKNPRRKSNAAVE